MAKKQGVSLPSGQGGIVGGVSSTYSTKIQFNPKFIIVLALIVVLIVFLLYRIY